MSRVKVSVTLDQDVAAELDQVAGRRNRSSFVNSAVRKRLQQLRLRTLLDEMERESEPLSAELIRRVESIRWPD